jgi:hypothetical protein
VKRVLTCFAFLALGFSAHARMIDCAGDARVNNIGRISTEKILVRVDLERNKMIYQGPHAAVDLPVGSAFEMEITEIAPGDSGRQYYLADKSVRHHDNEPNFFYLEKLAADASGKNLGSHKRTFVYLGIYGYRVDAKVSCKVQ